MIRTFVAVKVPCNASLRQAVSDLGEFGRAVKPVSTEGLHITLMFLGDTELDQIELPADCGIHMQSDKQTELLRAQAELFSCPPQQRFLVPQRYLTKTAPQLPHISLFR